MAIFYYQIATQDPEFERLLNFKKGEYKGICTYIRFKLSRLAKKVGNKPRRTDEEVGGILLLEVTFMCMSDESLHHYEISLWKIASNSFPEAKCWLEKRLLEEKESGSEQFVAVLNGVLKFYNFIPPQFL